MADSPQPAAAAARTPRAALRKRWTALVLGALCALLLVAAYAIWMSLPAGPRLHQVDRPSLDAARELWKQNGPASYDIEIAVQDMRQSDYRIQVRGGKVASAVRNGIPLTDGRTWGTWSVPGMFATIEADVQHAQEPIRVGPREVHYVSPLARFDPQYGFPERYRRVEWGSDVEASWEVTSFRVVE